MFFRQIRNDGFACYFGSLCRTCVAGLGLLCLIPASAYAQTAPIKCTQVLTAEQVRIAVGATLTVLARQKAEAGVTECTWSRTGGADTGTGPTIRLQFFERAAISANPVVSSPDGYYEMIASAAEEIAGRKREAVAGLTGAGTRAATVQGNTQILVLVQRGDGIARVVLGNLTKAQATAVARVISGP